MCSVVAADLKMIVQLKKCCDEEIESVIVEKRRLWRQSSQKKIEFGKEEFVVVLELLQVLCHEVKYLQRMTLMRVRIL
jgi:hypothetical protein